MADWESLFDQGRAAGASAERRRIRSLQRQALRELRGLCVLPPKSGFVCHCQLCNAILAIDRATRAPRKARVR